MLIIVAGVSSPWQLSNNPLVCITHPKVLPRFWINGVLIFYGELCPPLLVKHATKPDQTNN